MNIKFLFTLAIIVSFSFFNLNAQNRELTTDTLSMEAGYTNDLFYSMTDGLVSSVERSGWDLGFYTSAFSAGIIINEGAGVTLYNYPNGDTAAWASVDTSGMTSWTSLINSPEYWEDGAFNINALGHPDYGWGVYNMVTHGLTGDSIYVIDLPGVGLKKLWIVDKISVDNIYHLKYADLDGANEQMVELDIKPYVSKNFVYYSLSTNQLIDREPEAKWDIMFTKYFDYTLDNEGNAVPYLVTGATSNVNRYASKYYPVADDYDDWSAKPFDSLKNVIGYDWKSFSMSEFAWVVEDSTAFFVMDDAGDVHKLVFTLWEGSTTGVFALNRMKVHTSFINNHTVESNMIKLYPNPVSEMLKIELDTDIYTEGEVLITDISGRMILRQEINNHSTNAVNVSKFTKGIYFVTLTTSEFKESTKFIVR